MKWPRKNYAVYAYYPKPGSVTGETYKMFESSHWLESSAIDRVNRLNVVAHIADSQTTIEFRVERINEFR